MTSWTLDDALGVVRNLQPAAHAHGYHVTLGGGVLNRGESDKDVDLYFLPLLDTPRDEDALLAAISARFGEATQLDYGNRKDMGCYSHKLKFALPTGRRADVFIVAVAAAKEEERHG